ncbi:RraA family protein [Glaciecola sp. 1036]|uniref:RraA family protein n=1 Tax=Alteromonadaceae TaxID=72275 RepID=UPI003CFFF47D
MDLDFNSVSTCEYADALSRDQFMDYKIHCLYQPAGKISGPAFTVKCAPGDHLMLHAAIYRASPGDIIVVEADDQFAVAGGNVCAIAKERGIKGFVIDGVVRDIGEIREMQFPVFALGGMPKSAGKKVVSPLNQPVTCGGVTVNPGDIIVADEEGIACIPKDKVEEAYAVAKDRAIKDSVPLSEWRDKHSTNVENILEKLGYKD